MLFDVPSMMKNLKSLVRPLIFMLGFCAIGMAQTNGDLAGSFHNDRLKLLNSMPDRPLVGNSQFRAVDGVWVTESSAPDKTLTLPEQVKIFCENYGPEYRKCVELSVTLAPTKTLVVIQEINTQDYAIDRWDDKGLIASYGGNELDSKCQRHVLMMDFGSGAVTVSDIPTHMKGCEAFTTTNSYRLVRGEYYVDTTPNNDLDKPVSKTK